MNSLAARRRHPAAIALLLLLGLLITGSAYAVVAPRPASAETASADQIGEGKQLFQTNCATCHGANAQGIEVDATEGASQIAYGPSLIGVGAASVDFQMATGRMPLAQPGVPQAPRVPQVLFEPEQISAIAAYVASLAPGPAIPTEADLAGGDPGHGGEIYRVNCAMCHSSAGAGGALTRGKYAPTLTGVEPIHIYEAMLTGPQNMPKFTDANLDQQAKADVIAYLTTMNEENGRAGLGLGNYGPVPEGMFAWVFGLGFMIAAAVWLGQKGA